MHRHRCKLDMSGASAFGHSASVGPLETGVRGHAWSATLLALAELVEFEWSD